MMEVQTDGNEYVAVVLSPIFSKLTGEVSVKVTEPNGLEVNYVDALVAELHNRPQFMVAITVKDEGIYHVEWVGMESEQPLSVDVQVLHT